jgi:hypothetical protein
MMKTVLDRASLAQLLTSRAVHMDAAEVSWFGVWWVVVEKLKMMMTVIPQRQWTRQAQDINSVARQLLE